MPPVALQAKGLFFAAKRPRRFDFAQHDGLFDRLCNSLLLRRRVKCFSDPVAARDFALSNPVDVLITDYDMPGMNGLELLDAVGDVKPHALDDGAEPVEAKYPKAVYGGQAGNQNLLCSQTRGHLRSRVERKFLLSGSFGINPKLMEECKARGVKADIHYLLR